MIICPYQSKNSNRRAQPLERRVRFRVRFTARLNATRRENAIDRDIVNAKRAAAKRMAEVSGMRFATVISSSRRSVPGSHLKTRNRYRFAKTLLRLLRTLTKVNQEFIPHSFAWGKDTGKL